MVVLRSLAVLTQGHWYRVMVWEHSQRFGGHEFVKKVTA